MYSIYVDIPLETASRQQAQVARAAVQGPRPSPEDLHPALWRAWQMGQMGRAGAAGQGVLPSGYAELDVQLPGGGWPARTLTELLLPQPGVGELRLLAPALAALQGSDRSDRGLMWFNPPAEPCPWALAELGVSVKQLVLVRSRRPARPAGAPVADVLWAMEHALKSGHLGAVLAWLPPRLPPDALRRLQLAAQAHDGPVFLFRGEAERARPSPAPLRLLLGSAGPDALRVQLLKRRGPPQPQPLWLELPPVLSAAALERALQLQGPSAGSNASSSDTASFEA